MIQFKKLLWLFFLFASLSQCKCKDDSKPNTPSTNSETLPPITTEGKNTFGCLVNGKVWVAKSNISFPATYASIDRNDDNQIMVSGSIIKNNDIHLLINLGFRYKGTNSIKIGFNLSGEPNSDYIDVAANKFWLTDSLNGGQVVLLKYDSTKQILSGTFYFNCINKETNDTVKITDGRFDMNYTY